MYFPESDQLNIAGLSQLFKNKSECYKLFWFQALMSYVRKGQQDIRFEDLIDKMIADAWYMVTEYHLNLGPRDTLEEAVNYIASTTNMLPTVKEDEILAWLKNCKDPRVIGYKKELILNVPFRLQSPLLSGFRSDDWKCSSKRLSEKINQQERLMYYFLAFEGLNTRIHLVPEWMDYLNENQVIIQGWIQYNMILYLQRRNPSVPGISDKLSPPQERNLDKVKKYWKLICDLVPVHEIYGETLIERGDVSIDHFVPWSYVAHDELWNLHPTTRSINSQKSNHLPDWDLYFPRFASLEYKSYEMIWHYDKVHDEFRKCAKEHLNNPEIEHNLYQQGLSFDTFQNRLQNVIYPVYQSAKSCGFSNWEYVS